MNLVRLTDIWKIQEFLTCRKPREFYDLLKAYPIMVCFIHLHEALNLLVIVTMIKMEIMMTEKLLMALYFTWVKQHSHNLLRTNILLHFQLVK